MVRQRTGWLSAGLYMVGALAFAFAAAATKNAQLFLHAAAVTVLLFHAFLRTNAGENQYLIGFEKIRPDDFSGTNAELKKQIKDMLIDLVPFLYAVFACMIGYGASALIMWFLLLAYKFGAFVMETNRVNVIRTENAPGLKWTMFLFVCLVLLISAIGTLEFHILEAAVALLFVALMVAIMYNTAWLYLSPAIVLLLVFTVWPIINTVRMAFLEGYNSMEAAGGATFGIGVGNFATVITYKGFTTALKNTMLLCVITVPLSTILALLIAVALNSIKFMRKALQTVFFLPYVTNSIAIGMVFAAMFNVVGRITSRVFKPVSVGIVNNLLNALGMETINWINPGSEYWANIFVLVIYIVWNALPFKILVLLGGLQSINKQYYDAAKVDSTPRWRVLLKITVPLLSPMLAYVIITGFIGGFKEYTSIVGIFGENMSPPGAEPGRLNTIVGMIYDALPYSKYGRASAAALILFGIIFVVTMINLYVSKKRVHY